MCAFKYKQDCYYYLFGISTLPTTDITDKTDYVGFVSCHFILELTFDSKWG